MSEREDKVNPITEELKKRFVGKKIFVVSANWLNTNSACDEKGHLYYVERLVPDTKADFLEKGDLLHIMMEFYYKRKHLKELHHEALIEQAVCAGREHWTTLEIPHSDLEEVVDVWVRYARKHEYDGIYAYTASDEAKTPIVERQFSIILYEDELIVILYEGKIDLLAVDGQGNKIIFDHKWGSKHYKSSQLSNQNMGYALATGIMNVVLNKVGPQKDEDRAFVREPFSYTEPQLLDWRENTIAQVLRTEAVRQTDIRIKDFTSCDKWGGCMYRRVCTAEPDDRDRIKMTDYRRRPENNLFADERETEEEEV